MRIQTGKQIYEHIKALQKDKIGGLKSETCLNKENETWVSYERIIEFLSHSRSLEVAISDLKELSK